MSRESLVFLLGLLLFFIPWLGIPDTWKFYSISASGVVLCVVGYFLRRSAYLRRIDIGNGERGTDSFIESRLANEVETGEELLSDEAEHV